MLRENNGSCILNTHSQETEQPNKPKQKSLFFGNSHDYCQTGCCLPACTTHRFQLLVIFTSWHWIRNSLWKTVAFFCFWQLGQRRRRKDKNVVCELCCELSMSWPFSVLHRHRCNRQINGMSDSVTNSVSLFTAEHEPSLSKLVRGSPSDWKLLQLLASWMLPLGGDWH